MSGFLSIPGIPDDLAASLSPESREAWYRAEHERQRMAPVEAERERLRTEGNRKARRAAGIKGRRGERVRRPTPGTHVYERAVAERLRAILGDGP